MILVALFHHQYKEKSIKITRPKVLIIRLSSLGDVVMSTSVKELLAAHGFEVHYVIKQVFADVIEKQPGVTSVFRYGENCDSEHTARQKLFAWVEQKRFDYIIDLQDTLRTKLWRRFLREHSKLYVCRKPRFQELLVLLFRLKWLGFGLGRGGRARLFMQTAQQLLLEEYGQGLAVQVAPTRLVDVATSTHSVDLPSRYCVLAAGSAWPSKQWGKDRFAEVLRQLDIPVVLLGGKKEESMADLLKHAPAGSVALFGKTSLSECIHIIAQAQFVFGNDTGLVHIGEALGRPSVSIEGPTDQSLGFSLYRDTSVVVEGRNLWCRPCSKSGKICWRLGRRTCMTSIQPEQVVAALTDARQD